MQLIKNATIINEGKRFVGSLLIRDKKIEKIYRNGDLVPEGCEVVDATGMLLLPGVIDDQVHFREPGLTHKGDLASESAAAVAGGVTSYMDMPNTKPPTTTLEALANKFRRAEEVSYANYSFYIGATNDNIETIKRIDTANVCGVKLFMGSSTGNMLVDDRQALERIFGESPLLVAVHAEKEEIVRRNMELYRSQYGDNVPIKYHPLIRSEEACYRSSAEAVELAEKMNGRLHLLHLSTAKELTLLSDAPLSEKRITGEVCVHHLWFDDRAYETLGSRIKWNPAIKTVQDRDALREALRKGRLDVVATDHAPHLLSEKEGGALQAASGGPLIQYSLLLMLEMAGQGVFTLEEVVEKMSHAPAQLYQVVKRGYIREGYYADLVLIDPNEKSVVTPEVLLSKCGWSPFEGMSLSHSVSRTWVNGRTAYADGVVYPSIRGEALEFDR